MAKTEDRLQGREGLNSTALPTPLPDTQTEDDGDSGRRMDPELRTMGAMLRMLADLDADARGRVVAYLAARFPSVEF